MTHKPHSDSRRSPGISKTAIWVAAARAIGAREPDAGVRNPDHLAEQLLGDPSQLELDHPVVDALRSTYDAAMQDIEIASLVRAMAERTRFLDEALDRAIGAGITQVLILGAGLDSRAYRCRELLASARVFELDMPATLAFKQRRVDAALGSAPANLTYVPVDLQQETLSAALGRHGYDTSLRTFVIMEGVTMYVPEEALRATFRFVAAHAPDTRIVFDLASRAMIEGIARIDLEKAPPAARPSLQRFLDLIRDEPWLFGLAVGGERQFLAELGLELRELLTIGSKESVARYLTRADGTVLGAEAHAQAEAMRKAAQKGMLEQAGPEQRQKLEEQMQEQERQSAYRIAEAAVARK